MGNTRGHSYLSNLEMWRGLRINRFKYNALITLQGTQKYFYPIYFYQIFTFLGTPHLMEQLKKLFTKQNWDQTEQKREKSSLKGRIVLLSYPREEFGAQGSREREKLERNKKENREKLERNLTALNEINCI